ncbi:MAG: cation transporter, partial [Caldilineaceae bacterium]|nr:cation transporter [Caldilineaceae bacterium]
MSKVETVEVPICGMDCSECAQHVQHALAALPGVQKVDVLLAAEKAVIRLDPKQVRQEQIRRAVEGAGYTVGDDRALRQTGHTNFTRRALTLLALVFGAVLLVVVAGEWL